MKFYIVAIAALLLPATIHGRDHDVPADKTRNIRPQSLLPRTTVTPTSRASAAPLKKSSNAGRPPGSTRKPRGPTLGPDTASPTASPTAEPCAQLSITTCHAAGSDFSPPCPCIGIYAIDFTASFTIFAIQHHSLGAWDIVSYDLDTIDTGSTSVDLTITCGSSNPVLVTAYDDKDGVVCSEVFYFDFLPFPQH